MQHKRIAGFAFKRINELSIPGGTESGGYHRLGFPSSKQCRAVGFFQQTDFNIDWSYSFAIAAINTGLTVDDVASNNRFLQFSKVSIDVFGANRCLFGSNFPIEKLWTSLGELVAAFRASVSELPDTKRNAIFRDTATRVYRL